MDVQVSGVPKDDPAAEEARLGAYDEMFAVLGWKRTTARPNPYHANLTIVTFVRVDEASAQDTAAEEAQIG